MGKKKNKVRKQTKSDIGGNICRLVRTKRLTGVGKELTVTQVCRTDWFDFRYANYPLSVQ